MNVPFAKCLDRPIDVFGIKGKWITIFLVMVGASVLFALFLGFTIGSGIGISTGLVLAAVSFVVCLTTQSKISHRQVEKLPLRSLVVPYVTRRETLSRILYVDKRFSELEKIKAGKASQPK